MARFELKLPKMGESVAEATITTWLKEVGDTIEADEAVLEIATDKVDSEVPSEVDGVLVERFFDKDTVVQVGQVLAIIETDGATDTTTSQEIVTPQENIEDTTLASASVLEQNITDIQSNHQTDGLQGFYSPLVKNIAAKEGVSIQELEAIKGTGSQGRVTKNDMIAFLERRKTTTTTATTAKSLAKPTTAPALQVGANEQIIEMDRMRKMISSRMTESLQTAAHVQSFIEVDVTNIVTWRNKVKDAFFKKEGQKLTFTPIFMQVIAKALRDYPMLNVSVSGDTIIKKKAINLGMAAALANGNLIVPVIKNADELSLVGMAKRVNDLAHRARANKLLPDDVQDGTYTVTNVGSFGSIMGTPIINQPQVGILALGAIRKMPAVIETPEGDFIGIRQKMILSHSYDHRVVDGALGGMFIKRVAEYLEAWDVSQEI